MNIEELLSSVELCLEIRKKQGVFFLHVDVIGHFNHKIGRAHVWTPVTL